MVRSWVALWSKIASRFKQQGPRFAIRHYVGRSKQLAWQVIYDRGLDRLERLPSGTPCTIPPSDVLGALPPPGERLYQAFPRLPFLWSIEALGIDATTYSFVDYGSGRGRLLLTAARLPFQRVIGVEFARSLHRDACRNIVDYPRTRLACHNIVSLNVNATDFDVPDGNVVAFFFNPFTNDVLDCVAQRIEDASRASARSVYIIFANANRAPLFADRPAFRPFAPSLTNRVRLAVLAPFPMKFFCVGRASVVSSDSARKTKC